jgi:hypothetical protein
MAASVAASKQEAREKKRLAQKRAADRERSRHAEDKRWDAMHTMIEASENAQRIRAFVDTLAAAGPLRPDQARRLRKFGRWARSQADLIDPMSKGIDQVLARLGLPK